MPSELGKHTPYFELVDAQTMPGCPVCRLVHKQVDRYLDSILYEAVLDPDVRAKLKRSHGFCRDHTDMLHRKPGRALGVALIYRDIIRNIAGILEGARYQRGGAQTPWSRWLPGHREESPLIRQLAPTGRCPACEIGDQAETRIVQLLIAHLRDEKLYAAYQQGEGLCLQHLVQAISQVRDQETQDLLVRPQVARYQRMLADLDEFIRKRDHRFRDEKYGEEGDVWLRAMNAVVGGAGMGLSAKTGGRRSPDLFEEQR